jgi:hypothetical protein
MTSHIVIVAFEVVDSPHHEDAQIDGSDNHSAVFVPYKKETS